MRFTIEQSFRASVAGVVRALASPEYLRDGMSQLPDIGVPTIRDQRVAGGVVRTTLVFQFQGSLPTIVTKVIDPAKLSWIEETTIDLDLAKATFLMTPEHYASFFTCQGSWAVTDISGGSKRTISGSMKVNSPVPFVGGQVERAIVSGLRERLAVEPPVLEQWLDANPVGKLKRKK